MKPATIWPPLRTLKRHVREAYEAGRVSWVQCGCGAWVEADDAVLTVDGVRCVEKCTGKAKLRSVA